MLKLRIIRGWELWSWKDNIGESHYYIRSCRKGESKRLKEYDAQKILDSIGGVA